LLLSDLCFLIQINYYFICIVGRDLNIIKGSDMANYKNAFEIMIRNEGGYVNHKVAGDRGGQTYAGIARKFHPNWSGWVMIDRNDMENPDLSSMVSDFYKEFFWDKMKGDDISNQRVAGSLFDFAVNAGVRTASKLAQLVVDTTPDGVIGKITVDKFNKVDDELFITKYALAKVARYTEIVKRDKTQIKFLVGWLNRTLGGVA
jgi:lysozyme family protein